MSVDSATSGQFALDVQGLERLKHTSRQDSQAGLRGAAQQFEALLLQRLLKGMREASPGGGLLATQQGEFYQSLMDQQWAQTLSERGMGLADHLVAQLQAQGVGARPSGDAETAALIAGIPRGTPRVLHSALQPAAAEPAAPAAPPASFLDALEAQRGGFMAALDAEPARGDQGVSQAAPPLAAEAPRPRASDTPGHVERFVAQLAEPARAASRRTGVPAELILAQAALETGWGRREIPTANGDNSHNLFGIKAGGGWRGPTTEITTHEYIGGRRVAIQDRFRVYDSFEAAFTDYARLIGDNPRYAAVTQASSAEQAARALQRGGYATDPAYADKLIAVMNSLGELPEPTQVAQLFFHY